MFSPCRILVPTDMSSNSDKAIREAFDIAKHYHAEIVLLHVVIDPVKFCTVDFCLSSELVDRLTDELLTSAQRDIRYQLIHYRSMGDVAVSTTIRVGVPVEEILHESEEQDIDLIVMSALGHKTVMHHMVGGTTRQILNNSKCPVLLVK
jgi:nucleotide-binding universal stress UspA family protein